MMCEMDFKFHEMKKFKKWSKHKGNPKVQWEKLKHTIYTIYDHCYELSYFYFSTQQNREHYNVGMMLALLCYNDANIKKNKGMILLFWGLSHVRWKIGSLMRSFFFPFNPFNFSILFLFLSFIRLTN